VPLEALLEDPSLAALEAGEDADMLEGMDGLALDDDLDEFSSGTAGKGKRKPKVVYCLCIVSSLIALPPMEARLEVSFNPLACFSNANSRPSRAACLAGSAGSPASRSARGRRLSWPRRTLPWSGGKSPAMMWTSWI
jgi:hypothetical protein